MTVYSSAVAWAPLSIQILERRDCSRTLSGVEAVLF